MLLFANNATTTLASSINNTQTTITLATGTGALFPAAGGGDTFYGTLQYNANIEIVLVTNRSTDTLTVVRSQDNTTAPIAGFPMAAVFEQRPTAADFNSFLQTGVSGVTTVGAFSGSSQANGATISGVDITFGPADSTHPGMVTTGADTWYGVKTFENVPVLASFSTSGLVHNDSSGNLTTSLLVNADISATAAIVLSKLATQADQTIVGNVSGVSASPIALTAAQVVTMTGAVTSLTGDVTASGPGAAGATIAAGAVTLAKMANLAANSVMGNNTGSPTTPVAMTAAQTKTLLGYYTSGDSPTFNTLTLTTPLAIGQGGTGQSTANAALNALLPSQTGLAAYVLTTNGTNASWETIPSGYITSLAAIGNTPNADGMSVVGGALTLQPASNVYGGVVTSGTQTFAGDKTFGNVTVNNLYGSNTNPLFLFSGDTDGVSAVAFELNTINTFSTSGALLFSLQNNHTVEFTVDYAGNGVFTGGLALGTALGISYGGTGQTTAPNAINALLPSQTGLSGYILSTNGIVAAWSAVSPGYITALGAVGSSPNADAASVSTGTLTLQPADSSHPGVILGTSAAQTLVPTFTFSNVATFTSGATMSSTLAMGSNSITGSWTAGGSLTLGSTAASTLTLGNSTGNTSITGSGQYTYRTLNAATLTVDTTTTDYYILVTYTTTGSCAITLPSPTAGRTLYIKDAGFNAATNNITILQHASEKIENVAGTYTISWNGGAIQLESNGTDWFISEVASPYSSYINSLAAVGSSPNADAASVVAGALTLQPASSSFPGVIIGTSAAQTLAPTLTFAQQATFTSGAVMSSTLAMGTNTISGSFTASGALTFSNYVTAGVLHNAVTTGAITSSLIVTADITAANVTYAKIQNVAANSILGNNTGSPASIIELSASQVNTVLGLTNVLTGLTSDVTATASGIGTAAATIAAGAVTLAKMANLAANSIIGNNTGSPATPLALTASQVNTVLGLTNVLTGLTSDVTASASGIGTAAATIAANAVTYAKFQKAAANNVILGNISGAGTNYAELTATQVNTLLGTTGAATSVTTPAAATDSNGLVLTSQVLHLELADATHPGIIAGTSVAQTLVPTFTFSNAATFTLGATMSSTLAMGSNTISGSWTAGGSLTLGSTAASTLALGNTTGNTTIAGSAQYTTRTLAAATLTIDTTTTDYEVLVTYTATGSCAITLPAPTAGRQLYIKDAGFNAATNNITILQHASEKIENVAGTYTMATSGESVELTSNGTDWFIMAANGTGGGSGVTTVGAFSSSSQTNGANITGSTITFGPADNTNPGLVRTTADTWYGVKTFNSVPVASGVTAPASTALTLAGNVASGGGTSTPSVVINAGTLLSGANDVICKFENNAGGEAYVYASGLVYGTGGLRSPNILIEGAAGSGIIQGYTFLMQSTGSFKSSANVTLEVISQQASGTTGTVINTVNSYTTGLLLDVQNATTSAFNVDYSGLGTFGNVTGTLNGLLPSQSGVTSGWVLSTNGTNTAWAAPGAGGGATVGTATINFGSAPGSNLTSVNVTTSGLVAGSTIWCFMQADTTADHTATEHILADIKLVGQYVNSTTFTIWAVTASDRYTGQFEVRWAWQ